jgi:AraC-like DNA-binding protein
MAVAEIAATLGYTDASNFARAFRRQTGMSPIGYRRSRARQHVMGMSGEGGK